MSETGWRYVRARARLADSMLAASATVLTMLCAVPLFADQRWLAPAIVTILVIAATGAASRAIALPVVLMPIAQVIALGLWLTVTVAGDRAWLGIIPTQESSSALADAIGTAIIDARGSSSPVAATTGMVLLSVCVAGLVAIGLDTAFATARSPMLAGLVIAAVFGGCLVLEFGDGPWWPFVAVGTAWLLLLASAQRHRLRDHAGISELTRVRGLSSLARRTGLVALAAALLAAIVLPARPAPAPSGGTSAGAQPAGGSLAISLDPLVSMRRDLISTNDAEVLRYRTDATEPGYLRVSVLESFDGQTWRPRPGLESGRDPGWDVPGEFTQPGDDPQVTYDISVGNLQNAFLPLPYPIAAIASAGDGSAIDAGWHYDPATGIVFARDLTAAGAHYSVTAVVPVLDPDALRAVKLPLGNLWPQLALPSTLPAIVKRTAHEVTKDATTPYDQAVALQRWFTTSGGFTYSTAVASGAGADYIAEFLADKVGYCEQFAGAMALMARTLGIPARVAVGFTQGSQLQDGTWQVTVRDAHAWPELWFQDVGWVRFEPTPRGNATVVTPTYAPNGADLLSAVERRGPLDEDGFTPVVISRQVDLAGLVLRLLLLALTVGLVVWSVTPALLRVVRRRTRLHGRRYEDVVDGAWEELGATAIDLGQSWSPTRTARQWAGRLERGMPSVASAALRRLRVQVEQVRYGEPASAPGSGADERSAAVRADLRLVVRELRSRVAWRTRLAATYWPSSERRRQRSSMRFMKPADLRSRGVLVADGASSARRENAE